MYNDSYQSRLFENYKSKLIEKQYENKSVSNLQNLELRKKQLDALKKSYQVTKVDPIVDVGDIQREEYHVCFKVNNKNSNIRLQILLFNNGEYKYQNEEFPQKRPKFFLEKKQQGHLINKNTLELNYFEIFPWESSSNLVQLVKNIDQILNSNAPSDYEDEIQMLGKFCSENLDTVSDCSELNKITLDKLFPKIENHQKHSEYSRLANQPSIVEQSILCTEEYRQQLIKSQEMSDMVKNLSNTVKDTYKSLDEVKQRIIQKQELFDSKQQEYIQLHGEIEQVSERFEVQAAIALIDCEIYSLEDKLTNLTRDRFSKNLQDVTKQYLDLKKQQNYLLLLKQQYEKFN